MVTLINPVYLKGEVIIQMRTAFKQSKPNVLVLPDFFDKSFYGKLAGEMLSSRGKENYVPHEHRFFEMPLDREIKEIFSSRAFINFISEATGVDIGGFKMCARKFGKGNFSLMHDDLPSAKRFVLFYTISPSGWDSKWGGASVFSFGDERAPLVFENIGNSLTLISVPSGMRDFVKYVNHFAGDKRIVKIIGTLD